MLTEPWEPDFERARLIRFSDCDPAGIVFYPQYFVMFNALVEDWFTEGLGIPFEHLIATRRTGVPTAHLSVDFRAPSAFGDTVMLGLSVVRVGGKSIELKVRCTKLDGAARITMRQVLVTTSLATHQSIAIPDDIRLAIQAQARHLAPSAAD